MYILQKLFALLEVNKVLQMNSPALQIHLDEAAKVLYDRHTFLPCNRSYRSCDCRLQIREILEVIAIHSVLKLSSWIKI